MDSDAYMVECLKDPKRANEGMRLLLHNYGPRLYGLLRPMCQSHEDTDEVLQRTLINVWKRANFSETEARSYWQLKAAYEQQRRDLLQAERKQRKARAKTEDLSDEEARTLILAKMAHQRSLLDLQEAHLMLAMDQMGAAAVLRGLAAEKAWKRELLRRLREKHSLEEEEQELDF